MLPPASAPPTRADDVTRGNPGIREVAFTFDGDDQANVAREILDMLRTRDVRATVFLTGQFIWLFPDVVRRMQAEGHEIANHLDTHPRLTTYAQNRRHVTLPGVTREFVIGELRRAEASLRVLTGQSMAPYWRAPYGEHNAEIRAWAADAGYRHISWTRAAGGGEDLDTRDWVADRSSRIYRTREEIATRILEFGRGQPGALNGGIILMHLATHREIDRPHESLPHILQSLQDQGYRLVTISELLAHGGPRPIPTRALRSAGHTQALVP
jgi:peptidoglycan/xylan/chitin deacetylase (PgdA/CDA1 family)